VNDLQKGYPEGHEGKINNHTYKGRCHIVYRSNLKKTCSFDIILHPTVQNRAVVQCPDAFTRKDFIPHIAL
jgi:hypothetical protein